MMRSATRKVQKSSHDVRSDPISQGKKCLDKRDVGDASLARALYASLTKSATAGIFSVESNDKASFPGKKLSSNGTIPVCHTVVLLRILMTGVANGHTVVLAQRSRINYERELTVATGRQSWQMQFYSLMPGWDVLAEYCENALPLPVLLVSWLHKLAEADLGMRFMGLVKSVKAASGMHLMIWLP
jgi:hypothetical protein